MQTYTCVVSRYNEPLHWTLEAPFNQLTYVVYNKGVNRDFVQDHVQTIIELSNVGKDVHSFLHHIVSNYYQLTDVTIFLPASMEASYKRSNAVTLIQHTLETHCREAFFLGQYATSVQELFRNYTQRQWISTTEENRALYTGDSVLLPSRIRPYGEWYNHHFPNQETVWWSYNNTFSVDRRDILQHPITRYKQLLEGLSQANDVEEAHFVERSWAAIFGPFRHTNIVPLLM